MQPMVGLSNYENMGLNGFGTSSWDTVQQLHKALSAGYESNPALMTGGSAMRVESLEESLKIITYTDRHIKFWRDVPKTPAYNTVEEYNQQDSYGNDSYGAFLREGELPLANDSSYRRRTALVKFIGTTREITHPATLILPAHGDLIAKENESGILWLLKQVELALFHGDSTLAFNGAEGEQWDGLDTLISPDMYVDLEGGPPQEADFEEVSNLLARNFAYPSDCYTGYTPLSDLVKTMYPRHRINLPPPADGQIGQAINSIVTQAGVLRFNQARFLERPPTAPSGARGPATHVPTAPASIAVAFALSNGTGEFDKSQGSLDARYAYIVTAANRFGESAPSPAFLSPVLTAANAQAMFEAVLTITNAPAVSTPPEFFNIYRTVALDAATAVAPINEEAYSLIARIPAESQANNGVTPSAPGTLTDINRVMPFTEQMYVGELDQAVISFRQLAPLMKMDLAVLAPAYRWMILLYGVLVLFAPRKWSRIINIGRLGA